MCLGEFKQDDTDEGDEEWDPQPAELRDGEEEDLTAHAQANLEAVRSLRKLIEEEGDE